ncbi:MAG: hypothetical protein KBT15_02310 [Bacteroidales bacterium]|nr:hypothetical protein [Candidatus Minthousia equi]
MNKIRYIFCLLMLAMLHACSDQADVITNEDGEINVGDEVMFTAYTPQAETRSAKEDYDELIKRFESVQDDYEFNVEMFEEGIAEKIASATYNPTKNTVEDVTTYDEYGTLTEASNYLYWPSNVKKYAFHAVSSNSSTSVEEDQTTAENFFKQDLIEGYGYVPGWDETANEGAGAPIRNLDGLNHLTSKEWYAANKSLGTPEGMTTAQAVEYWKKIPLYMRHKRSRITIRLRAGEGVERNQIAYDEELTPQNIHTEIYSYDDENNQTIVKPLLSNYNCEYRTATHDALPEEDVLTACYDAIVNAHNYADGDNMTDQKILMINLSGLKFSFYAANDKAFSSEPEATNDEVKARYNLTAGKHLILDVTLSTDTRKILITAYVVDWEDWPFSSICDDFGQASDPMPINNKDDLIEFLNNPEKNKPGNVAVIIPLNFNLNEGDGWDPNGKDLKATLKFAGATITTSQRLFDKISPSGSVVNGTVIISDKTSSDAPIECAIAKENYGTVERINVLPGETTRQATRAGLVTTNYGTIYACTSQMPVYNPGGGSEEILIGGIAAEMLYPVTEDENGVSTPDLSTLPTIDQCNVNARIDGGTNVKGGGIAGKAEGKLSNNTYEHGITLLQNPESFKNILYAKGTQDLNAYDNEWSTKVENTVINSTIPITNVRPESDRYNQVIESQAELDELIANGTYNNNSSRFRIAGDFTIDGDTWNWGKQNIALNAAGNLLCELNCNNKTITLTGTTNAKMLFSNIQSHLYDLVLMVDKPIVAMPDKEGDTDEEKLTARAPLAYAVVGDKAILSNVKVKSSNDAYILSTASAGLVVWAYDGAIIEDCQSDADIRIALPEDTGNQQTYFIGGLVNSAAKANILRCNYQRQSLDASQELNAKTGSKIFYGGIVGGTSKKTGSIYDPSLIISDCTSWLSWENTDGYPHATWGGIIGYSKYQNTSLELVTATNGKECQGNWWVALAGASADGWALGMNEEKVIGKKNSIQPTRDPNY